MQCSRLIFGFAKSSIRGEHDVARRVESAIPDDREQGRRSHG